ncbi:uncharacterized protein BCR38DRAFT_497774 [Pseudomassariella vexata]|uniref:Uncharacterized protein n=1 Tax=Pseudomassariella vexata TaxID=1141098 RepID=A0A1Y2DLL8_9PEZI|nr:uncharacterized protein BCR38DRAFT_497774 [Pseudomassariella vexata]ORY60152.1 hypothetical protein BCR38DRAFT_497774 [Pseudomassariella vexata]
MCPHGDYSPGNLLATNWRAQVAGCLPHKAHNLQTILTPENLSGAQGASYRMLLLGSLPSKSSDTTALTACRGLSHMAQKQPTLQLCDWMNKNFHITATYISVEFPWNGLLGLCTKGILDDDPSFPLSGKLSDDTALSGPVECSRYSCIVANHSLRTAVCNRASDSGAPERLGGLVFVSQRFIAPQSGALTLSTGKSSTVTMPGVTLNNEGTGVPQTPVPPPVVPTAHRSSGATSNSIPAAATARMSHTPVPVPPARIPLPPHPQPQPQPQPHTQAQAHAQAPAPAPAQTTVATAQPSRSTSRSSPPPRPNVEPLTPPLNPVQFPPARQTFMHSSQLPQSAIPPPPPEPIEFETNPDVLALKSALSILQMQGMRAKRDMVTFKDARDAALEQPEAYLTHLLGEEARKQGARVADQPSNDSDRDSSSGDEENSEVDVKKGLDGQVQSDPNGMDVDQPSHTGPNPWASLPTPQNIYRCPPINWGQYAVVGESLDRIHKEEIARPPQGAPATLAADGRYEPGVAGGREELVGIAAPYNPLRDRIDKKPKGSSRQ